jgi:hypothetical protein
MQEERIANQDVHELQWMLLNKVKEVLQLVA